MFEQIELQNFQCHPSLSLSLDRITTLVGASDSGKTAVLRALDWVCYNRGKTAILLRRGASDVSVSLKVDGHTLKRTSKDNAYYIDNTSYTTIGRSAPPELGPLLRMGEDNVQRQHDGLFWFNASGSALVSNLNRVVDLSKLEEWAKIGASQERHFKERVGYFSERKADLGAQRDELLVYKQAADDLTVLEALSSTISTGGQKCSDLRKLVADYDDFQSQREKKQEYIVALTEFLSCCDQLVMAVDRMVGVTDLLTKNSDAVGKIDRLRELCDIKLDFDGIFTLYRRFSVISKCVADYECCLKSQLGQFCVDLASMLEYYTALAGQNRLLCDLVGVLAPLALNPPSPANILTKVEAVLAARKRGRELLALLRQYDSLTGHRNQKSAEIKSMETELDQKTDGRCPLCGHELGQCVEAVHA